MIISYQRPDTIGQGIDPEAPALDLSSSATTCGATTYDVAGVEWSCTRAPHPGQDTHQAAQAVTGQPVPVVGLAWGHQYATGENTGGEADEAAPVHSVTVTVSFPARAIGVDVEKIRSAVLDLFWEGDADDVQLVASTAHDVAETRAAVAELVDLAQRGHEDFEHQAGYGDYTAADGDAAHARWYAVQQLTAELTRHIPEG
ncbi:hypothetical protein EDF46_3576 [Frondihabitans sp. PhB188]|uniref:hypothetical protein n=1 Tax=Frondihabitans sp. PhB188 TaxID=2485200 RepID=UPI000F465663|nr:hypothetical protein [Frondihabitans sp. PhB188]ROQ30263.1 hypothetical protein EDF46_3576 [Frondihabitans sp. PhB188]